MSVDQLAPEAMKLSARDRALLAGFLWESLDDPYAMPADMTDDSALELAEKRDAELNSGKITPLSHAELMAQLRR